MWAFMMWGVLTGPLSPTGVDPPLVGFVTVQTLGCTVKQPDRGAVITSLQITCITARHILKISSYSTHTRHGQKNWFIVTKRVFSFVESCWCRARSIESCSARLEVLIYQILKSPCLYKCLVHLFLGLLRETFVIYLGCILNFLNKKGKIKEMLL